MMAVDSSNPEARPATAMNPVKNRSGIIVPHQVKWPQAFLALIIYVLLRLVGFTLRYRWNVPPNHLPAKNRPYIFAIWHNRLALSLIMYGKAVRRAAAPFQLAAIVSASKDGGVLARVLEHFGAQPVRGSSSRRGPQALLELTSWAVWRADPSAAGGFRNGTRDAAPTVGKRVEGADARLRPGWPRKQKIWV